MKLKNSLHGNKDIILTDSTIIIGFSGGPDSVYLLLFLKSLEQALNLKLIAAHLDHQWRLESAQEAEWCKQFCNKHNIAFISQKASNIELPQKYNGSKEQYARQQRRIFLEQIAQQHNASHIALAQHKDDQVETFFIRLARGTSLTGLIGMKEVNGMYIRPLLNITKQYILEYLDHKCVKYLTDPSNQDPAYLRNRIRNTIIPALHTTDSRFTNNIVNAMQQLHLTNEFLNTTVQEQVQRIADSTDTTHLNIEEFMKLHTVIQQRIILQLLISINATFTPSQSLFKEIIRFLQSNKHQEHTIHPTYKIVKKKNYFSIIKQ